MLRRIACAGAVPLLVLALASPANASVPSGNGLVDFGQFDCEGLGSVSLTFPRGEDAPTGWTSTGSHIILTSLNATFTDAEGNEFSDTKTYGAKAAFVDTFTCTQPFGNDEVSGVLTATAAIVPPQ